MEHLTYSAVVRPVFCQLTAPQLPIMIIYNRTWTLLIQWIWVLVIFLVTLWPSKYKRNHTSCLELTFSYEQKKSTEMGGDYGLRNCALHNYTWGNHKVALQWNAQTGWLKWWRTLQSERKCIFVVLSIKVTNVFLY